MHCDDADDRSNGSKFRNTDPRDINVNPRLCLRAKANALASLGHTSWLSRNFAEAAGCSSPPGGFFF